MRISRKDVRSDILESGGFFRIPPKPYLDLLGTEPVPPQIAILNAVNSLKYRFICAAIARRLGKTYIANIAGQLVVLVPGSSVLIMAPNYSLSQISFDLQRSLIRHFDLEVARDNAKEKIIELENGSSVRMGSVSQVDSVVGRSYDFIIFDEAALTRDGGDAFNIQLRPTLDKPNSKALFISTPRGRNNWFAEFYQRGFSDQFPEWVSIHATWRDNPRSSVEDIEEARRIMSESEFAQEYEADFAVFQGQIWNFNDDCIQDLSELDISGMDIIAGIDVGFRDPTAFCVFAYDGHSKYYLIDEYQSAESTTEAHARIIQSKIDKWGIDYIFMDSAAQQTRFDWAQNYDISTYNADKSVNDGIEAVAVLVDHDQLIVDQRCSHSIASLQQYQWDPNPNLIREKPLHNQFVHMADAIRYALYSFRTTAPTF